MADLWTRVAAALAGRPNEIAADNARAPELLVELLAAPSPALRELLVVSLERFRSIALLEALIDRSFAGAGRELPELALAILGVIDTSGGVAGVAGVIVQLRARAWGAFADALRSRGELEQAERSFLQAAYYLALSPDPLEEGRFFSLRARLRRDQGSLASATALQRRAVARLIPFAQPHLVADAWIELAELYLLARDPARACQALRTAADLLDPQDVFVMEGKCWEPDLC